MACSLTQGYGRICKSQIGGIKSVYLFSYVKYSRSQLVRTGLTLTQFPATDIYQFEPLRGVVAEQKMNEDNGSKFYEQSITLKFSGHQDTYELEKLIKKDVRIIFEDNNGNLRMFGAYNGLYCDRIDSNTGGGKQDFSGLDISFTGQEREEALFLEELEIPDITVPDFLLLEGVGFFLTESQGILELE